MTTPDPITLADDVDHNLPLVPAAGTEALTAERHRVEVELHLDELLERIGGLGLNDGATAARDDLVAWLVEQWSAGRRDIMAAAMADVDNLEATQAATIELATASATFSAMAEWSRYLAHFPPILRQGLSIRDSHDLAVTVEQELQRVTAVLAALTERHPELRAVLGDAVGARAATLQDAAGNPIGG